MSLSEQQHREDIVRIGRMMYERGWIAGTDGNISIRLDAERILATPTGMCKGRMSPDDLIVCDNDGNKISGQRERSTEMAMHLAVYAARPEINGVVHAHPPIATGFAVAGRALNLGIMPELIVTLGSVPLAEYGLPGTPALVEGMLPFIPKFDAILLANHGAVAYGTDVHSAFGRMETVEHLARITLVAEMLGGPKALPRVEVEKLFAARERYGVKSPNRFEPGNPITAEELPDPSEKLEVTRQQIVALVEEALRVRGAY
ncbi:MAG: class II aldolase/adducin family protein [Bryobacteraceae bacterium]